MKKGTVNLVVNGLDYNYPPIALKRAIDSAIYSSQSGECHVYCNGNVVAKVMAEEPKGNFCYYINPLAKDMAPSGWTWDKTLSDELRSEFRKLSRYGKNTTRRSKS